MHKIRARLIGIITSKSSSLGKLVSYFSRSSPPFFLLSLAPSTDVGCERARDYLNQAEALNPPRRIHRDAREAK